MDDTVQCPICDTECSPLPRVGDAAGFDCPKHGRFKVSDTVFSRNLRGDWEAALERAKENAMAGEPPTIRTYDFNRVR